MEYQEQVAGILREAENLPDGPLKIELFEEAARIADLYQDLNLGFQVRQESLFPCYHANRADLLLVHFAWCLAAADHDPRIDSFEILWSYRWVIDSMPGLLQITRDQIESSLEDMRARFLRDGLSLRCWHVLRRRVGSNLCDWEMAADAHRRYRKLRHDIFTDDLETEEAFDVFYVLRLKQWKKAIRLGEALLAKPYLTEHFRGLLICSMLEAWIRMGMAERAAEAQPVGLKLVRKHQPGADAIADQVLYFALIGEFGPGLKLFEKSLSVAESDVDQICRFTYYRTGRFLLDRILRQGKSRLTLRVPATWTSHLTSERWPLTECLDWMIRTTEELADQFDRRNGNNGYHKELAELAEWEEIAEK